MSSPQQQADIRPEAVRVHGPAAFALAVVVAIVLGSVAVVVIGVVARALGASSDFKPLAASTDITLTVIGVLGAAVAWSLVRSRARRPRALMRWLAPTVVVVSFVPDILLGTSSSQVGTSWGAIVALMVMHLAVAVVAVTTFWVLMPLPEHQTSRA